MRLSILDSTLSRFFRTHLRFSLLIRIFAFFCCPSVVFRHSSLSLTLHSTSPLRNLEINASQKVITQCKLWSSYISSPVWENQSSFVALHWHISLFPKVPKEAIYDAILLFCLITRWTTFIHGRGLSVEGTTDFDSFHLLTQRWIPWDQSRTYSHHRTESLLEWFRR